MSVRTDTHLVGLFWLTGAILSHSTTAAVAFGVNEALKRAFPDESKTDPTKRPDLLKPFLMVRKMLLPNQLSAATISYNTHTTSPIRVQSQDAALQRSCYQVKW